jgi:hypothetical protein
VFGLTVWIPTPNPVDAPVVCVPKPLSPIPDPNPEDDPRLPGVPKDEVFKLDPKADPNDVPLVVPIEVPR